MHKKLQLIIILLFCMHGLKAQTPFWQFTHLGWGTQMFEKGDTIITVGTGFDSTDFAQGFQLNKYLRNGNRISKWHFRHDSILFYNGQTGLAAKSSIVELNSGMFLWGGQCAWHTDSLSEVEKIFVFNKRALYKSNEYDKNNYQRTNAVIFKINNRLDSIVDTKVFSPSMFYTNAEVIYEKHPDSLLILFHENPDGVIASLGIRLVETDASYNERWSRKITFGEVINIPRTFLPLRDGGYLILMELILSNVMGGSNVQHALVKISKTGQLVFKRPIGSPSTHTHHNSRLISLDDGSYLVTYTDSEEIYTDIWGDLRLKNNDNMTIWMQHFDINGNTLGKTNVRESISYSMGLFDNAAYQTFFSSGISTTKEGDILVSGYHAWGQNRGFLIKMRKEDLSACWIRCYEIDKENYPFITLNWFTPGNFITLSDGRLATHGSYFTNPTTLYPQGMQGGGITGNRQPGLPGAGLPPAR